MTAAPEFRLDPATLLFCIACMGLMMGAVSLSLARATPRQRHGLNHWGGAMLTGGLAFMLISLRPVIEPVWSYLVANALVVAFPALGVLAFAQLLERKAPYRTVGLLAFMGYSCVPIAYVGAVPNTLPAFTLAASNACTLGLGMLLILRHAPRWRAPAALVSASLLGVLALAFLARALVVAFGDAGAASPTAANRPQVGLLIVGAVFINGASLGYFFMVQDRQRREALDRARRDLLTGLYTRAGFFELAEALDLPQAPANYAIVMVDIDHFKRINDTHGHLGGDLTLAHAARLVNNSARISDLAGRYGGEEFCVLLRDCAEADAGSFAERLVQEAARQTVRLRNGEQTRYTVSAGYAARRAGESLETVIDRADQGLYLAKRSGRNCVRRAGTVPDAIPTAVTTASTLAPAPASANTSAPAARPADPTAPAEEGHETALMANFSHSAPTPAPFALVPRDAALTASRSA